MQARPPLRQPSNSKPLPGTSGRTRLFMRLAALSSIPLLASLAGGECLSIEQTKDKTGARACVSAKVIKVVAGRGAHFLDFCDAYSKCPFTVVVFDRDLRDVGDIRQLEGKVIEIHGKIVQYEGRSEIILRDSAQLKGASPKLPPVPKADRKSVV